MSTSTFLVVFGLVLAPFWLFLALRWRRTYLGLLLFLPFAGAVSLWLQPSPIGPILKDLIFALPCYFVLFGLNPKALRGTRPPDAVLAAMAFLALLVLLQTANPGVANFLVAAIGTKVWLFYMPLIFVAAAYVESAEALVELLRRLTLLAVLPCLIGLLQWGLSATLGYEEAIGLFYGDAAYDATQAFARFYYGGDYFRIPSTFSFVTQYFGFLLAMMPVAYSLTRIDPSRRWRRLAALVLVLLVISSFLSGSRQAFVFVPLLLALMFLLDGRLGGLLAGIVVLPLALFATLYLGGLEPLRVLGYTGELVGFYSEEYVIGGPLEAISRFPFGTGTGMNTGAARYAFEAGDNSPLIGLETYYGKAIVELGAAGLLAVALLFGVIIWQGWRQITLLRGSPLRSCAAAFVAFFIVLAVNSGKGWLVDNDPINVYFWVFAGMLFKLRALAARVQPGGRPLAGHTRPFSRSQLL